MYEVEETQRVIVVDGGLWMPADRDNGELTTQWNANNQDSKAVGWTSREENRSCAWEGGGNRKPVGRRSCECGLADVV